MRSTEPRGFVALPANANSPSAPDEIAAPPWYLFAFTMKIITLEQIKKAVAGVDLLPAIEAGFVAYSEGKTVVPPVGELRFDDPPGDVHIKYGYLRGGDFYVIKIASGFYDNPQRGLPASNGMMLLFDQKTGVPVCALLDECYLTDLRTAVAGAICAKHLAAHPITRIGIVGTGVQARMQLRLLKSVTLCSDVLLWGRTEKHLLECEADMERDGFFVVITRDIRDLAQNCNLIVTTTSATAPLLLAADVRPGTHITAVGADSAHKQELEAGLIAKAEVIVADSISQCVAHGDLAHPMRLGLIQKDAIRELGAVISGKAPGRTSPAQISIADLTGVAVQDLQIATAVYRACAK